MRTGVDRRVVVVPYVNYMCPECGSMMCIEDRKEDSLILSCRCPNRDSKLYKIRLNCTLAEEV